MLGRLCYLNPAAVLPHLRQQLTTLISELNKTSDNRLKEEAALLVCNFMRAMSFQPIVKAFLGKPSSIHTTLTRILTNLSPGTLIRSLPLESRDVRLTSAALEAVGEICLVNLFINWPQCFITKRFPVCAGDERRYFAVC